MPCGGPKEFGAPRRRFARAGKRPTTRAWCSEGDGRTARSVVDQGTPTSSSSRELHPEASLEAAAHASGGRVTVAQQQPGYATSYGFIQTFMPITIAGTRGLTTPEHAPRALPRQPPPDRAASDFSTRRLVHAADASG